MSTPKAMEEKRKKFGMEMLPSLHKRLKQLAADREVPLWSLTQQAIEQWLLREVPEKDERQMTDSTDSSKVVNQIGTFHRAPTTDSRTLSKDSDIANVTEKTSSGSSHIEVPAGHTDSGRLTAAVEEFNRNIAELRASVARVEKHLTRSEKRTKPVVGSSRVVPRGKRKHPPGASSGA